MANLVLAASDGVGVSKKQLKKHRTVKVGDEGLPHEPAAADAPTINFGEFIVSRCRTVLDLHWTGPHERPR